MLQLSERNFLFQYHLPEWDLNLHVIKGGRFHYLIDTGLGSDSVEPVKALLQQDEKPVVVINTHYHWDHIWGNAAFPGAIILSHRTCREMICANWDEMLQQNRSYISGEVRFCPPNLVFEDSLSFPGDGVKIFYTPGHTKDCISVLDEQDKVLNAGDNIGDTVDKIVPCIDTNPDTYIKTLLKYKSLDFNLCVSGHNLPLGKDVIDRILKEYSAKQQ